MSTTHSAVVVAAYAFAVDHIASLGYDRQSTETRPWFHVERRINQHATMFAVAISGFYTVDIKATSKGMVVVACLLQPNTPAPEAAPVVEPTISAKVDDKEFNAWLNESCETLAPVFTGAGNAVVSRLSPINNTSAAWIKARRIGSGIARFLASALADRSPVVG